jgi:hypothetical protein
MLKLAGSATSASGSVVAAWYLQGTNDSSSHEQEPS